MSSRKTLPKDTDNDYSLPGRFEEGNAAYFYAKTPSQTSKNRGLFIMTIVFLATASGFFLYYFMNQSDIDSRIIQNTFVIDPEKKLVNQYDVGKYGSEHSHAAIVIFIQEQKLDFSYERFQLASKYIHFENHNPYLIHKHAVGAPLEMLFVSLGIKISKDCIILNYYLETKTSFCSDEENSLEFYVNGNLYPSDLSTYVFNHNDRILITYGDGNSTKQQLEYLKTLEIFDIPKKIPRYSGDGIFI